jgi:hypothetical protein
MYAVIGSVRIHPGQEDLTGEMITTQGVPMLRGMAGSQGGYWARTIEGDEVIQHSFWVFDSEENARSAEQMFSSLRDMPDAPATFLNVEVCEVLGAA